MIFQINQTQTDPLSLIMNLLFFVMIFISMFYGQKIQGWKAAKEIEAGLEKLKKWNDECKQILLTKFKEYADKKETDENGGESKSLGWGYDWDEDIAKKTVLRTHTTATTIRRLAQFYRNNEKVPVKVFCIDRVFRNEKLDKSHLAEFTQVEGIVIDEGTTLCDLIGLLSEFYRKLGFKKIITRPGFFPYTEPSMDVIVWFNNSWLELGGSGIFRPEVTEPLGVKHPVLAWGLGLERLAMLRLGLNDIRKLYISDIDWLRKVPLI